MPRQTVPDLKELFKQAAEIAEQVPPSMQEAAFNRALDLLTGAESREAPKGALKVPPTGADKTAPPSSSSNSVDVLLNGIDSTQHPGVTSVAKVIDRALMILQIALRDHSIDGLTPTEIARVLTDKFRVRTTRQSVAAALEGAAALVDRVPQGRGHVYRIMGPGEEYLAHVDEEEANTGGKVRSAVKTRRKKKPKDNSATKPTSQASSTRKAPPKRSRRPGPLAMIRQLAADGFFDRGRTINDIRLHTQKNLAYSYKATDLSPTLARALRNGILTREENADGQYEYKKA